MESSKSHFIFGNDGRMADSSRRIVVNSGYSNRSTRHHTRGTVGRSVAVSVVVLIVAGCSPYYTNEPGPKTPPQVVGIEWTSDQNDYDSDCALGLTTDGLAFVAGAGTPWGLGAVAAEWLSYKITGNNLPVGAYVGDCWNALTNNSSQFALYLKCYGEPYIKYWFDNMGEAERWVAIPMCQCNIGCQGQSNGSMVAAWKAQARAEQRQIYCQIHYYLDLSCQLETAPNGGWNFGGGPNAPATDEPASTEGPLPSDWNAPWWDTTAPIPMDY
jgi:hypothetical protein